jgi:hypothetical protein
MIFEGMRVGCEGVDWILMSQGMDQWGTKLPSSIESRNFITERI